MQFPPFIKYSKCVLGALYSKDLRLGFGFTLYTPRLIYAYGFWIVLSFKISGYCLDFDIVQLFRFT